MSLTTDSFEFVADLVRRRSAIQLEAGKEYLVESRLAPLARRAGLGLDEFVKSVRAAASEHERDLVVEALTTNETSWFRDGAPFVALRQHIVPALTADAVAPRRLRVWSAACSTGQEPYSIAMTLQDALPSHVDADILATDLSEQVLARARAGLYSQLEVDRGLPSAMRERHFQAAGSEWRISDELRAAVRFMRHNLLDASPAGQGFDLIFLRNVLIYFDVATKQQILARMHRVLRPGGFLVLGAAETTIGVDDDWERLPLGRGSVYRPRGAASDPPPWPATVPTPFGSGAPR
ncbi:protein-glutamate O-methyltransferase CheR [Cellulomonas cellasea]|uniref:CheR family methyltransferase n=1 Tax=Cellulomonas cellasea TaxID=43670 RepID=UPI0025A415E1|nr:protein-glutamate O-methyltransferase CheR [Cellulomonas cellasea]MDM8083364.1 protein-glutamate O-methyltransferase CheR [Cellulomonas cellasea]